MPCCTMTSHPQNWSLLLFQRSLTLYHNFSVYSKSSPSSSRLLHLLYQFHGPCCRPPLHRIGRSCENGCIQVLAMTAHVLGLPLVHLQRLLQLPPSFRLP